MRWSILAALAVLTAGLIAAAPAVAVTQTFDFTGSQQSFLVPAGVTQVTIEACGAQGGGGSGPVPGAGANGACVTATIAVRPGETLAVFVGGQGGTVTGGGGGDGGDSSDVRGDSPTFGLSDRLVVGGGGGGGGGGGSTGPGGVGGAGGEETAAGGSSGGGPNAGGGGGGGTQVAGGAAGTGGGSGSGGSPGVFGGGGGGGNAGLGGGGGGGGGGGYFGGGGGGGGSSGGGGGGAGGGSSFALPGATNVSHAQGSRSGDGRVVITYNFDTLSVNTAGAGTDAANASGTVTSSAGGISCSRSGGADNVGDCTEDVADNTVIATPDAGSTATISGACSSGPGAVGAAVQCALSMDAPKSVTATFTRDLPTTPPETSIDSVTKPSRRTRTITFSSPDAVSFFECSIDGGPFSVCTSPFTTDRLSPGLHTVAVRAVDASNNRDPTPAEVEVTIKKRRGKRSQ